MHPKFPEYGKNLRFAVGNRIVIKHCGAHFLFPLVSEKTEKREQALRNSGALLCFFLLAPWNDLLACAVCFGDPNSPLTHGARAAVWFLLGVVALVLCSILGVGLYWFHRARLLEVQSILHSGDSPKS